MLSGILVAASCHATSMASRAGLCCAPSSPILPLPLDTWKWPRLGPFPASSHGFLPSVAPKNNSRPRQLPLCASLPFALALCLSPSLVKRGSVGWVGNVTFLGLHQRNGARVATPRYLPIVIYGTKSALSFQRRFVSLVIPP